MNAQIPRTLNYSTFEAGLLHPLAIADSDKLHASSSSITNRVFFLVKNFSGMFSKELPLVININTIFGFIPETNPTITSFNTLDKTKKLNSVSSSSTKKLKNYV